jgi:NTP pyrophosphatase (non-canonical NTP hydrolase)
MLSKSELERLAILAEECAEVQHMVSKIIRHGYESYNPFDKDKTSNRKLLEKELGDLLYAIELCTTKNDIDYMVVEAHIKNKELSINKYLHYN